MKLLLFALLIVLVDFTWAGTPATTTVSQTTSAVSRSYVGVIPLSIAIGFQFASGTSFGLQGTGDIIKVTASQIVFKAACTGNPIGTGGAMTFATNPSSTTSGTTNTISLGLVTGGAAVLTNDIAYVATIPEACLLPAPTSGSVTFTVEAVTATGVQAASMSATSWTWTPQAVGSMSNVEVAVDPTTAGLAAASVTTYNVKFQPGVAIPIGSLVRIVATGASPIFVAGTLIAAGSVGGGPAASTLTTPTISTISNGHVLYFTLGGADIPNTGVITLAIVTANRAAHPSTADTVITVNVESTDLSGNAFNKQQSTIVPAQQYTLSGTMSQVTMEFERLTISTSPTLTNHPLSVMFKFAPSSVMTAGDWVQLRVGSTGDPTTAIDLAFFTTAAGMPDIISADGCTWKNKARPGVGTIEFTMSVCTIKAGTLTSIVVPAAYLVATAAAATNHFPHVTSFRTGTTAILRNAAQNPTVAIVPLVPALLPVPTTAISRNIVGTNPVSMTVTYTLATTNFQSALVATDVLTLTAAPNAFSTSITVGSTLPFTAGGGGCTLTYKGTVPLTAAGLTLQFTLTGATCTQAAASVNTFVLPATYLGQVIANEVVTVGFTSAGGGIVYVGVAATALTTTTTAGIVTVSNSTALPVLFPSAPLTGLRVLFSSSLTFAAGDFVTFTSTAIAGAAGLNLFKTTFTSGAPVTLGNCIWTVESTGNTALILRWKLSNNGAATCLIAANEVVAFEIPSAYLEKNPAANSNPRITVGVQGGTGATDVATAPVASATLVLGYRIIGQLPPTGPAIDLMAVSNESNRSDWVNGIVVSHVQNDNATQGRIVWTKCGEGNFPQPLMPEGHPVILKMKLCGPGVLVIRTCCFIQSFNLGSLGVTINTQYPPVFGCNVDKFDFAGRLLPDISMQIEASYSLAISAVVLYRTSKPTGTLASSIGGTISVGASGIPGKDKASLMLVPQTSLVTGATSTTTTTTNATTTSPTSGSSSSSSDDSALAIGLGIGLGVGIPLLLALLAACWYFLFGPGARASEAAAANEVFYVADEKYGPQGNAYGYYGQAPGQVYGYA